MRAIAARGSSARDIAHEQGAGRLPADIDAQVVARLLLAILDGLELQHLLDPESGDIAGPLEAFFALLRGSAPASEPQPLSTQSSTERRNRRG